MALHSEESLCYVQRMISDCLFCDNPAGSIAFERSFFTSSRRRNLRNSRNFTSTSEVIWTAKPAKSFAEAADSYIMTLCFASTADAYPVARLLRSTPASPLQCAHPKNVSASPLKCALAKSLDLNRPEMTSCKKGWGASLR